MSDLKKEATFLCSFHKTDSLFYEMIDSLLKQSYENFKVILVNDIGQPVTFDSRYQTDNRVALLHNPSNQGLIHSLNRGVVDIDSEYIARVDRGDICLPERLKEQVEYLEKNDLDIVGSYVEEIDEAGKILRIVKPPLEHSKIVTALERYNCLVHSSILMKTEVIKKLGGYNERFQYAQDYDLYLRAIRAGCRFGVVDKILTRRRVYRDSTTRKKRKQQILYASAALMMYYAAEERLTGTHILRVCAHLSKILIPQWMRSMRNRPIS
ncbi:MAG: glycosyltransferase [Candidatus Omnitrophica bacterium]|nr:glycosyltransferase [Candidatus Omnitrophota bacterium]